MHTPKNTARPLTHALIKHLQELNTLMPSLDRTKHSFNNDTAVGTKDFAWAFFLSIVFSVSNQMAVTCFIDGGCCIFMNRTQVTVADPDGQTATTQVTVFLNDINDNNPKFDQPSYEFKVLISLIDLLPIHQLGVELWSKQSATPL
jgi:hypothetical protein